MEKVITGLISVFMGLVVGAVFSLLFGWFVLLLWNWLMPTIFGLTTIGYWQAWGLSVLGGLLFGGSRGVSSSGGK